MVWVKVQSEYSCFSTAMYNIYRAPSAAAGIERNYKINKRVMNQRRCRMAEAKIEKQVYITHNIDQLNSEKDWKGSGFELYLVRQTDLSTSANESGGTGMRSALDSNEAVDDQWLYSL